MGAHGAASRPPRGAGRCAQQQESLQFSNLRLCAGYLIASKAGNGIFRIFCLLICAVSEWGLLTGFCLIPLRQTLAQPSAHPQTSSLWLACLDPEALRCDGCCDTGWCWQTAGGGEEWGCLCGLYIMQGAQHFSSAFPPFISLECLCGRSSVTERKESRRSITKSCLCTAVSLPALFLLCLMLRKSPDAALHPSAG